MKKYLFFTLTSFLLILNTGCEKKDDHDEEYTATINITSPAEGTTVTEGDEVNVEAEISRTDNKIIHNVSVIIEDADGNVVETLVDNEHVHAEGHHHIHEHYHAHDHGDYTLRIITTDHDDVAKKVEATRSFTVMEAATYDVTVDIQEPAANTTIDVNDNLAVKVVFTHNEGGTIHHVKIDIIDEDENVVATLDEGHIHAVGTYTYESATAYTATTAGTFRLVAMSMNHDMSIVKTSERTFEVQ